MGLPGKAGIEGSPGFPFSSASLPKPAVPGAAHPRSPRRNQAHECPRCTDPAPPRPDTAFLENWPAPSWQEAGSGGGERARGRAGGGAVVPPGPAPRPPPPAPRAATQKGAHVPSPLSAARRFRRSSPRRPTRRRSLLSLCEPRSSHSPTTAPSARPCAAPVSCQVSRHTEGPQARGSLGAPAGAEGLGWGLREPRPAAHSCPEDTL